MIPIVPMPVFPYPDWDAVFGADLRASNADRDVAADILCAAVADGRLTLAELDERLEEVLSARTLREIARLISDLPGPSFPEPVRPAAPPKQAKHAKQAKQAAQPPAGPRPQAATRWTLLQETVGASGRKLGDAESRVAVGTDEALPLVTELLQKVRGYIRMPDFRGLMNKAKELAGKHPDQVDKGVKKGEDLAENKLGSNYDGQIKQGGDYVEGTLGVNESDRQPE